MAVGFSHCRARQDEVTTLALFSHLQMRALSPRLGPHSCSATCSFNVSLPLASLTATALPTDGFSPSAPLPHSWRLQENTVPLSDGPEEGRLLKPFL